MDSLISVIIPVYNPGVYFEKCMENILSQTYSRLEIILIDDGSTDGSEKKCDYYAHLDNRVKVVHKKNGGVSKARNAGLEIATGDYYHFPDSDDYIDLDTYEYLLGLIEQHNCDVVNFEHFITYPDKEIAHSYADHFYGLYGVKDTLYKMASGVQFCCNKLFSKNLVTEIRFNEEIARGEDTLFAAMAIERANKIWFDKRPLYHYVQTEESACRGQFRPSQLSVLKLYEAFEPIYGKYPDVWEQFKGCQQEGIITVYFDLWANGGNKELQFFFLKEIERHYSDIKKSKYLSSKQKIKFAIFNAFPHLFCYFHKLHISRRR